jgi:NAD(P)-dependent dehydrogenase (short-subunit alcohol dehydrogenase family)
VETVVGMDLTRLGPAAATRAVVVGGCGGIGREYVRGLVAAQCRVVVLDRPSAIGEQPPPSQVRVIPIDVTDEAALEQAFAAIEREFGGLDVLAHLAGIMSHPARVTELDLADYERVMNVNLRSALVCARMAIPIMQRSGGGTIVLTSSGLATNPEPTYGAYSMSKAALIALAKTIAKEGATALARIVGAPGVVDTAFLSGGTGGGQGGPGWFQSLGDLRARILASIPMQRMAQPADVAGPMLFLSGEASRYMTGQVLYINGGRLMP